jgi:hypothetical protein
MLTLNTGKRSYCSLRTMRIKLLNAKRLGIKSIQKRKTKWKSYTKKNLKNTKKLLKNGKRSMVLKDKI